MWVFGVELEELTVSERDWEVCWIGSAEVYWGHVDGLVSPHRSDNFLSPIPVIDEWGYYLGSMV